MTYSIEFYALKEHEFAARLQSQSPDLLSELETRLRAENEDDDEDGGEDEESDEKQRCQEPNIDIRYLTPFLLTASRFLSGERGVLSTRVVTEDMTTNLNRIKTSFNQRKKG